MKKIDITYGEYASRWGLTDFYDESAEKLKSALESGADFDTGWFGCKKEIVYARITRENGMIVIQVSNHMDNLYDDGYPLIYDAFVESGIDEVVTLPQDIIDSILDKCDVYDITNITELREEISGNSTFEEVVDIMNWLDDSAKQNNGWMFARLCEIAKEHYEYMKENNMLGGTEE